MCVNWRVVLPFWSIRVFPPLVDVKFILFKLSHFYTGMIWLFGCGFKSFQSSSERDCSLNIWLFAILSVFAQFCKCKPSSPFGILLLCQRQLKRTLIVSLTCTVSSTVDAVVTSFPWSWAQFASGWASINLSCEFTGGGDPCRRETTCWMGLGNNLEIMVCYIMLLPCWEDNVMSEQMCLWQEN